MLELKSRSPCRVRNLQGAPEKNILPCFVNVSALIIFTLTFVKRIRNEA
jgi:hypothetical protein